MRGTSAECMKEWCGELFREVRGMGFSSALSAWGFLCTVLSSF